MRTPATAVQRRQFIQSSAALACCSWLPRLAQAKSQAVQPRLPLEHFARRPFMEEASISPDGTRMAVIVNNGENSLLVTRPVDGAGAMHTLLSTNNLERQVNWVAWVNNERLLVSLRFAAERQSGRPATPKRWKPWKRACSRSITMAATC